LTRTFAVPEEVRRDLDTAPANVLQTSRCASD